MISSIVIRVPSVHLVVMLQRKIEGVWEGRPRTYDPLKEKVAVVWQVTHRGGEIQIPDMLSTEPIPTTWAMWLGATQPKASYIENAVTSNPVLQQLSNKSKKDIQAFIELANRLAGCRKL